MKEEALKLAKKLEQWSGNRDELWNSAYMIRKLVAELESKEVENIGLHQVLANTAPQTKRLSVEEIEGAFYKKCWYYDEDEKFDYYGFAREIEERHGIK